MTIIVFVKAPVPGKVKTRLQPVLSPEQAAALYRAMAQNTVAIAIRAKGARVVVAYDIHPNYPHPSWIPGDYDWIAQRGSELGKRLQSASDEVFAKHPAPLVIIGSDLPDLTVGLLAQAKKALETNDVVIGPATDGGYYLIGFQKPQPRLFENIPWSGPDVLATTLAIIKNHCLTLSMLSEKSDLDTPENYQRLRGPLHAHHPV